MVTPSPAMAHQIEQATAGDPEAIQNILQYLNASNPDLRHMMQTNLHSAANHATWQRLLECIGHERWTAGGAAQPVTPRSVQSMIEVYAIDSGETPEVEQKLKDSVLTPALLNSNRLTRWAGGYICGLRTEVRAIPILDEILRTPANTEEGLSIDVLMRWQLRAVQALASINGPECGAALIVALASPERGLHHAAGQAIGELGHNAEPALLQALHHPDSHVRWHAARALGQIGDLRAVDTLVEGLYDDNQEVRWVTARVLAYLDAPAIPAILQTLTIQENNEALRQSAYHALNGMVAMRQPEIRSYLQPLLDTLHPPVIGISPAVGTAQIARQLLDDWKNVSRFYTALAVKREDRRVEIP